MLPSVTPLHRIPCEALSGTPRHSEALRGTPRQSEPIRGNLSQGAHLHSRDAPQLLAHKPLKQPWRAKVFERQPRARLTCDHLESDRLVSVGALESEDGLLAPYLMREALKPQSGAFIQAITACSRRT